MFKKALIAAAAVSAAAYLVYAPLPAAVLRAENALRFSLTDHPEKTLYLTFDDGPDPHYTGKLLDLLAKYQIHATFFTVADFAQEHPELIRRMQKEGHTVACHSRSHKCAMFQGPRATKSDLSRSLHTMKELGVPVDLYRAPWGLYNLTLIHELKRRHIKRVLWNVMIGDWSARPDVDTLAHRLLSRVRPGAVICLHDGRGFDHAPARTIRTLERVLPELKKQGYQFKTL
jgi:peptidoglycan/xylan/chitin deacetylase (PgdA/CDA1 family)